MWRVKKKGVIARTRDGGGGVKAYAEGEGKRDGKCEGKCEMNEKQPRANPIYRVTGQWWWRRRAEGLERSPLSEWT